jgi:hypothetical protein
VAQESSDESDLDLEFMAVKKKNKRKLVQIEESQEEAKKPKLEVIEEVSEVVQQKPIQEPAQESITETTEVEPKQEPVDYPEIDLKNFNNVGELAALGLGHLKHALDSKFNFPNYF